MKKNSKFRIAILIMIIASIIITSVVPVSAGGKVIAENEITLVYGKSLTLYKKADNVSFSTSNKKVACVSADGTVKSMGRGICTITAVNNETGAVDECKVTVKVSWWKIFSNLLYYIKNLNCETCRGEAPEIPTTETTTIINTGETTTKENSSAETTTDINTDISTTDPATDTTSETETSSVISTTSVQPFTEPEYAISFGDEGDDRITSSTARSNIVYICGQSDSRQGEFATALPKTEFAAPFGFVSKINAEGERLWSVTITDSDSTVCPTDIAVLSNGSIVVVGYMTSPDYITSAFIAKYTSSGSLVWLKTLEGENSDSLACVAALADGFVAGGKTKSSTGDFEGVPDYGNNCAVFITFDKDGNILRKRYLGGNGISEITDIDTDSSGNIFAAVSSIATDGEYEAFSGLLKGSLDNIIIKYNSECNMLWYYTLSTNGRDNMDCVAADGNGGCLAGGYYRIMGTNAGIPVTAVTGGTLNGKPVTGGTDSYIVKLDSDGTKKWDRSISGSNDDFLTGITKTLNGYIVSGYSDSTDGIFNSNAGSYDAFACLLSATGKIINCIDLGGTDRDVAVSTAYGNGYMTVAGYSVSKDGFFEGLNSFANIQTGRDGTQYIYYDCFLARYKVDI